MFGHGEEPFEYICIYYFPDEGTKKTLIQKIINKLKSLFN